MESPNVPKSRNYVLAPHEAKTESSKKGAEGSKLVDGKGAVRKRRSEAKKGKEGDE